ncbi:MAG TPA: hypothetical protein VM051_06435 [Usitatibacter sp.]|nr:hypothetical protein [Usitatibacter sp.]
MRLRRRQFIQAGLGGAVLLALARWMDGPLAAAPPPRRFLDARGVKTVTGLVPVVLAGALPADEAARRAAIADVVADFDRAVAGLALPVQQEIGELFSFLHTPPLRVAFAGLWAPVEDSTPAQVAEFLARWRDSRFELQRASYRALTQLIQAAWYGHPGSWAAIGYPGPPTVG